jgi:hypothetical protein
VSPSTQTRAIALRSSVEQAPARSLEELLVDLCAFGAPKLSRTAQGWFFWIKVHVTTAGTSFEVSSDMDHPTPRAALELGMQRLADTLKEWT